MGQKRTTRRWEILDTVFRTPRLTAPIPPTQNPYGRSRMANNIDGHPGNGPSVSTIVNPNTHRSVFEPLREPKRRKTQQSSSPRNHGPSGLSKRAFLDKPIDLTEDDAELVSHTSTVADDSDDSLDLRTAERSKARITDDLRAIQRLQVCHGGGEPPKAVDADTETEAIVEFPLPTGESMMVKGKGGRVPGVMRNIESRNDGKIHTHGSPPNPSEPLNSLPPESHKPKVRLFTEEEGWLTNILITRRSQTRSLSPSPRCLRMDRKASGKMYVYP